MKTFANQWIFQSFETHPTFFTKRMFGGLAAYLYGRQMMVLVEPTSTGRWNWHGVLICTDFAHHAALQAEFTKLAPHDVLRKWLFIDTRSDDFESTMERVAEAMARNDRRFGIQPRATLHKRRGTGPQTRKSARGSAGAPKPSRKRESVKRKLK